MQMLHLLPLDGWIDERSLYLSMPVLGAFAEPVMWIKSNELMSLDEQEWELYRSI